MKKLLLIAATWLTLSSCTKEASAPLEDEKITNTAPGQSAENVRATVKWTSDPAVDGLGWVLRLSTNHSEIPKNLPEAFKKDGTEVIVSYKVTGERFPCRCAEPRYYVEITAINYLNP